MSLIKNSELEKSLQMRDSLNRIQKQPKEIWVVKMADRITNLLPPPGEWNTEKVAAYREEANEIYDVLSPASEFLAKRLKTKIETYARRQ
jgi:(p)ppGpp synthase/HD superfamily hydrolase